MRIANIGGDFTKAGGNTANYIAKIDSTTAGIKQVAAKQFTRRILLFVGKNK